MTLLIMKLYHVGELEMTREEAIKNLNMINVSFDIAIQALLQEPKTGHWITHPKGIYAHLVCDKCLSHAPYDCRTNYCPNCGANMMESEDKKND